MPRCRSVLLLFVLAALSTAFVDTRPLPFHYDLFTFRGPDGATTVVTAYAVEAGELEIEDAGDRARYRFSVSLVLADTAARTVSDTHDTVYVEVPRPFHADHLLYTHVDVEAQPSTTTLQRVLMMDATTPGIGQLYNASFRIPDYSGSALMLSDIALAYPDVRDGWQRGDARLALFPSSLLPNDAFDVYYEIYNLPPLALYSTRIDVEYAGDDDDGARPLRLTFEAESGPTPAGVQQELRRVDTSLPRGRYRITVTVTDNAGKSATRSRYFEVRGGDRGATMVAALPSKDGP